MTAVRMSGSMSAQSGLSWLMTKSKPEKPAEIQIAVWLRQKPIRLSQGLLFPHGQDPEETSASRLPQAATVSFSGASTENGGH